MSSRNLKAEALETHLATMAALMGRDEGSDGTGWEVTSYPGRGIGESITSLIQQYELNAHFV